MFGHYLKDAPAPDWIRASTPLAELDDEKRRVADLGDDGPEVAFNHAYVVLDGATYAALREGPFPIEELARVDTGLPTFDAPTADSGSLYVRGRTTYLELLGPDNPFGEPVGKVGLGLGVDDPADLPVVERLWTERLEGDVIRQARSWTRADPPVPWMDVLLHPGTIASPTLVAWVSAYRPEFLDWLYPERSGPSTSVRRADFLGPQFDEDRLLEDVTGLTLALPADLRAELARQLEVVGYARQDVDGSVVLRGPGWTLTLVEPTGARTGLVGIELSTTGEKAGSRIVRMGPSSVLTFGPGRTATWSFL